MHWQGGKLMGESRGIGVAQRGIDGEINASANAEVSGLIARKIMAAR